MTDPAPGRFSTKTLTPSCSASRGATRRPTMSVPPPDAIGTMIRIGFDGYVCASHGFVTHIRSADVHSSASDLVSAAAIVSSSCFLSGNYISTNAVEPVSIVIKHRTRHESFSGSLIATSTFLQSMTLGDHSRPHRDEALRVHA